jgi:uncharacterized membrane protein YesL
MDNKFFRGLEKLIDGMFLSALWLLFCLPIVTIGASTTAVYYTAHKSLRRGRGYIFQCFWGAFCSNFKQATGMWLIMFVIFGVFVFDQYVMSIFLEQGSPLGILFYVFWVMIAFALVWMIYCFAYLARFDNKIGAILKNAALLEISNLLWSIVILLITVVAVILIYTIPFLIILVPAFVFVAYDAVLERIFRKIMSPEDLEKERENDQLDDE